MPLRSRHGLEIRAATGADTPGLSALLAEAGQEIAPHEIAARLDALRRGQGMALVALEWGPPSGIVTLHWHQTLQAARPVAQIALLLVAAADRRRGIGRVLVEAAAQAARSAGCGSLELMARPDQPSLQAFGRALGFAEAGLRLMRSLRKRG